MAQTQYKVIAGAVPMLHDRLKPADGNEPKCGDILPEDFFKPGEIGDLLQRGFIEAIKEEEKITKKA